MGSPLMSRWSLLFHRLCLFGLLALLTLIFIYCFIYLGHSYAHLRDWFFSLDYCFYRGYEWTDRFFTPSVKALGNRYAIAGMVAAAGVAGYLIVRRKAYFNSQPGENALSYASWPWYVAVVALACAAWGWGTGLARPGADEIFSAVNCAEKPLFHSLAYYMLPNNHIYFNVINHFLVRITHSDGVLTGRAISLVMYAATLCSIFYWLLQQIGRPVWAFLSLLPVALQFIPWAFGFQARGYEFQLLCAWGAFITLFACLRSGSSQALRMNTLFCIAGFAIVPTFLYYLVTQVAFIIVWQIHHRRFTFYLWRHLAFIGIGVFLLYLPAITFSGTAALTANDYVRTPPQSLSAFLPHWLETTKYFINFIFSFIVRENHPVNFVLFAFPVCMLFSADRGRRSVAIFYVLLWGCWAVLCLYMKRTPFGRNMIFHYSFSGAIIIYTLYAFITSLTQRIRRASLASAARNIVFGGIVIALTTHLAIADKDMAGYFLYFLDVNGMYTHYNEDLKLIPPNSSVAFSDERYCFYYYCRKGPYKATTCISGTEEYFVKADIEPLPPVIAQNYTLYKVCFSGDIYKHK